MSTPQYIKNAQNAYNAKFDLVQLKLPKGTKERIKSVLDDGQSMSGYCVQSVLIALESDDNLKGINGLYCEAEETAHISREMKESKENSEDLQGMPNKADAEPVDIRV